MLFPSTWWSRVQSPESVDLFLLIPAPAKTSPVVSAISQKQYLLLCLVCNLPQKKNPINLSGLSKLFLWQAFKPIQLRVHPLGYFFCNPELTGNSLTHLLYGWNVSPSVWCVVWCGGAVIPIYKYPLVLFHKTSQHQIEAPRVSVPLKMNQNQRSTGPS
jgi:hypothetical protein